MTLLSDRFIDFIRMKWSPDGRYIAYTTSTSSQPVTLHIYEAGTGQSRELLSPHSSWTIYSFNIILAEVGEEAILCQSALEVESSMGELNKQDIENEAEENAFLQITKYNGGGIRGGMLFVTASPCELCSKNAYQLVISTIVYINPYPEFAKKESLAENSICF